MRVEGHKAEADRARAAKKWVERWKTAVFRGGPVRAVLREAGMAYACVAGVLALEVQRGGMSAAESEAALAEVAAERKEAAAAGKAGAGAKRVRGKQAVELAVVGEALASGCAPACCAAIGAR